LTAIVGSLSWFASPLNDLGIMLTKRTTGPPAFAFRLDLRLAVSFFAPGFEDRGGDCLTAFLLAARLAALREVAVFLLTFLAGMLLLLGLSAVRTINLSA
jgi:hypothetical protein